MKRTAMKTEGKKTYKKINGGTLRLADGRIIKPNQIFQAYEWEISLGFTDSIVEVENGQLRPMASKEEVEKEGYKKPKDLEVKKPEYKAVQRENSAWWDIQDVNGKKVNDKALRTEEEANKTISILTSDDV